MCKSPRAQQVTGKMLHIKNIFKRLLSPIAQIFIFELNASFRLMQALSYRLA